MTPPNINTKKMIHLPAAPRNSGHCNPDKKSVAEDPCLRKKDTSPLEEAINNGEYPDLDVEFSNGRSKRIPLTWYGAPILYEPDTGASYYINQGNPTAWHNGGSRRLDIYDLMTVAHRFLPFGTIVRVTAKGNDKYPGIEGRSVYGIVADRGPYMKGRNIAPRSIDLVKSLFYSLVKGVGKELNMGLAIPVSIEILAYPTEELINCYCRKGWDEMYCPSLIEGEPILPAPPPMSCSQPDEKTWKAPFEEVIATFQYISEDKSDRSQAYGFFGRLRKAVIQQEGKEAWESLKEHLHITRRDGGTYNYTELYLLAYDEATFEKVREKVIRYIRALRKNGPRIDHKSKGDVKPQTPPQIKHQRGPKKHRP